MEQKNTTTNEYLKTKVMTATPVELQLMLYDGAIRFCEQARIAIEKKEIESSFHLLTKAENIIMEMCKSLKDEHAPETCEKMRSLYIFCYEKLVTANIDKSIEPLNEALSIIRHMRETWIMLMGKIREERNQQNQILDQHATDFNKDAHPGENFDQSVGSMISVEC